MEQTLKDYLEYQMILNRARMESSRAQHLTQRLNILDGRLNEFNPKNFATMESRKKVEAEILEAEKLLTECQEKVNKINKRVEELEEKYITIDLECQNVKIAESSSSVETQEDKVATNAQTKEC